MPPAAILLIVSVIAIVIVLVVVLAIEFERKRRAKLQAIGAELGFEYLETLPGEIDGSRSQFQLLNTGRARKASNVLSRQVDDLRVLVFDYAYTTGAGKHQHRHSQSVGFFQSPALALPSFRLTPEGWLSRLGELFGGRDIDFDDDPEFSRAFKLTGVNEAEVRALFSAEPRSVMVQFTQFSVEAGRDCLIVWSQGRRAAPEETRTFFENAFQVYSALRSAAPPLE